LEGPLNLKIYTYRSIPKSFSKKKHEDAINACILPITKPDCSNICKGIEDALKGVIWKDDSQVVELVVYKFYSDVPRVEVDIEEIKVEQ